MTRDRRWFWRGYDALQIFEVVVYPVLAFGVAGSLALARYTLAIALGVIVIGLYLKLCAIKVRRAAARGAGR
jgi:hypothetical protein